MRSKKAGIETWNCKMKKCILIAVSIAMIIILSACNSKTEYNYSESDKTLAEDIYTFANEKYKEEDNVYLMAICLFSYRNRRFP